MAKAVKHESKSSSKEVEDGKAFAFLGVFLGLIGFVIVLLTKKENKYAMYYAKQGLVLTIACIIVWIPLWIILFILAFIPVIGWIFGWILAAVFWVFFLVLWFIGWINALSGVEKPIPLIGQFGEKFKF